MCFKRPECASQICSFSLKPLKAPVASQSHLATRQKWDGIACWDMLGCGNVRNISLMRMNNEVFHM